MTVLFIEDRRAEHFDQRVRPVFESRGVLVELDAFPAIRKSFQHGVQVWEVYLDLPVPGSIHKTQSTAHRPVYIHDSMVHFNDRKWSEDEDVILQVESIFGRNASCRKMPVETQITACTPRQLQCVAFSSESLTILAVHIPSLDAFLAIDIWPNELVPLSIAAQRIGEQISIGPHEVEFVELSENGERFVTDCVLCEGDGSLTCDKCNGTGDYLPRKQCPKCSGSGNYIGKYGDVMGDCRACDGNGYWEAKPCNICNGQGIQQCYKCQGETVQWVRYDRESDRFTTRTQDEERNPIDVEVPVCSVQLQHLETNNIRRIPAGGRRLIDVISEASKSRHILSPGRFREVRTVQQMIGGIADCLQKALQAIDPTRYTGSPITLSLSGATTQRKRRSAVYDFRVVGMHGPWQKTGESPFSELTPLRLLDSNGRTPLGLTLQADRGLADRSSDITFLKVRGSGNLMTFTIQFPVQMDPGEFPETFTVLPDQISPGEKQQIRHVHRFAHPRNQNHAVIPAMVVPKELEFEDGFEYFDPTIGNNRRQAEAVQLGLSDTGLSLLKGPPGTGKTTVITEIVRQRIKQGQRVLVTSKNHQAVVNVLEKLDEVGGIRMARHGSSSDPGETERRYLTGGVRTRVHEEVFTRSQSSLAALEQRLVDIERYQPKVSLALDAASKLEKHRDERRHKVRVAEQERDSGLEAAELEFKTVEDHTPAAVKDAQSEYDREKLSAETRIDSRQAELQSQSIRLNSLQQRLGKRSDTKSTKKPGFLRSVVDRVGPEFMASTAALKTRREQTEARIRELEESIAALNTSLKDAASRRDKLVNAAKRELTRATKIRSKVIEDLNRKCNTEVASAHLRLHEQERWLLPPQSVASTAAELVGAQCSGDESEEYWKRLGHDLALEQSRTEKKLEFIRRWVRDLEADPTSVGQCYWDNLQVFFSTCVGIASWKDMLQGAERFDFVIVDEAATVTTGETIMPLMYAKAGMLVGDEMQLPPHDPFEGSLCCDKCKPMPMGSRRPAGSSKGKGDSSCWLSTSFFEYLWRERPDMSRVMLDMQYRMNPRIASFVGNMFYPEGLHSGVSEKDRTLRFAEFTEPMCLISTSAYKDRFEESRSSSYFNDLEARMIRRVIVKAAQQLDRRAHFGIITPYAEQVRQLQSQLKGNMREFEKVRLADDDIASVNSFQGSQRDVIIVSFVRSPATCPRCKGAGIKAKRRCSFANYLGQNGFDPSHPRGECRGRGWLGSGLTFVQDLQRLNVALSRAKSMVILVGDIEALTNPKFTHRNSDGRGILENFEKYVSDTGLVLRVWETEGAD